MSTIDFEQDLNPEQLAAVTAPDGPILVLAAAGTGKTRTLVYRVAYLSRIKSVLPDRILLLTFTNRAAREMLERAEQITGGHISGLWGGTFHHMANRILRRYAPALGYKRDYSILDSDDSRSLVANCIKEHNFKAREFPSKAVLQSVFSVAANTEIPVEDVVAARLDEVEVDLADILRVHRTYVERKRRQNAMDFDDMLTNCLKLLRDRPDVLRLYQEQFQHTLVDEYQDTNTIQAQLIDLIASHHRNILVVGDDFQSIYAWRGADYRNIMEFPETYPDAHTFKLETNYRSTPEILAVANKCIEGNPDQFQKTLRASRGSRAKPRLVHLRDGHDQARYVIDTFHQLVRKGYERRDIAVLYRAHFHAMELQIALTRSHIEHVVTSGIRFFEQAHVKDVCSILRILENPGDEMSFQRLMTLLPGVGPGTVQRLWKKLNYRFDAAHAGQRQTVMDALRPKSKSVWEQIDPVFNDYAGIKTGHAGSEILVRFVEQFYHDHAYNVFDNARYRIEDVQAMIEYVSQYETISEFLTDAALLSNVDGARDRGKAEDENAIQLSTVHQAKGLEWPAVIILWATEGMFPSSRAVSDPSSGGLAEERRLFYVAITRAKDELHIGIPEMRRGRDGSVMFVSPSPFIEELPRDLFRSVQGNRGYSNW